MKSLPGAGAKIASLAGLWHSPADAAGLLRLLREGIYPVIPCQGSVGASGDLAPLAHLSAALLGVGEVRHKGRILSARRTGPGGPSSPETLRQGGLALLNGTQVSTALALAGLLPSKMCSPPR
jgi:histidine ammonia-lyase